MKIILSILIIIVTMTINSTFAQSINKNCLRYKNVNFVTHCIKNAQNKIKNGKIEQNIVKKNNRHISQQKTQKKLDLMTMIKNRDYQKSNLELTNIAQQIKKLKLDNPKSVTEIAKLKAYLEKAHNNIKQLMLADTQVLTKAQIATTYASSNLINGQKITTNPQKIKDLEDLLKQVNSLEDEINKLKQNQTENNNTTTSNLFANILNPRFALNHPYLWIVAMLLSILIIWEVFIRMETIKIGFVELNLRLVKNQRQKSLIAPIMTKISSLISFLVTKNKIQEPLNKEAKKLNTKVKKKIIKPAKKKKIAKKKKTKSPKKINKKKVKK